MITKMKRKLSPGGGRTIYNKFPKARQKASVEALKEGGMKKDRLASGYKARRKDPRSLVKAGVEAFKKKRVKKMGGGMMGRRMGYSKGSNGKPISRSKNPGVLAMSKTAKGRKVVKEKFKFNPDRVVARKGGIKKTGGGADMGNVASDKTKKEARQIQKKANKRAEFLKKNKRSFGSIMREKYMR